MATRRGRPSAGASPPPPRRPLLRLCLLLVVLLSGCVGTNGPHPGDSGHTVTDTTGARVDASDVTRLVVTSVDLAETVALLGHTHLLAGVPAWIASDSGCVSVLDGLAEVPRIGRPVVITAENVLSADPTLVLDKPFPLSPRPLAPTLRELGVPAYQFDHREDVRSVHETFDDVASILEAHDPGVRSTAERQKAAFTAEKTRLQIRLDALAERPTGSSHVRWALGAEAPRAIYQLPAGIVAANGTSGGSALERAGLQDIAAGQGATGYLQLSGESLAAADPEFVVSSCTAAREAAALYESPKYRATTAARIGEASFVATDPALTGIVGPRFIEGAEALARTAHPAAFGLLDVNVSARHDQRNQTLVLEIHPETRTRDTPLQDNDLTVLSLTLVPRHARFADTLTRTEHPANITTRIALPYEQEAPRPNAHVADLWISDAKGRSEVLRVHMP